MKFFEKPLVKNHVSNHLISGITNKNLPFIRIILFLSLSGIIISALMKDDPIRALLSWDITFITIIVSIVITYRVDISGYEQMAFMWLLIKIVGGIFAVMCILIGFPIELTKSEYSTALSLLIVGLLWLPIWEFISKVTPFQKYVSLLRFGSLSILYFYG